MEKLAIDGGEPVRKGSPVNFSEISYGYEELAEVLDVFRTGYFCQIYEQADKVKKFEKLFGSFVGSKHAISFTSGSAAQDVSLVCAGIRQDDEVIVPTMTFASTAYTILRSGGTPVFADIDEETLNIDPKDVEKRITSKTKALIVVHWLGQPADMDRLTKIAADNNLVLIEDCAMALGSEHQAGIVGSFGKIAAWSLQQTKIITSAGEGGLLTTEDDSIDEQARSLRDHGKVKVNMQGGEAFFRGYRIGRLGINYRLTELQGAFAIAQMGKIQTILEKRRKSYDYLERNLSNIPDIKLQRTQPFVKKRNGAYFAIRFDPRKYPQGLEKISDAFSAEGVITYPIGRDESCLDHPLFEPYVRKPVEKFWPATSKVANELLLLPMHPNLTQQDLNDIVEAARKVSTAYAR